MRNLEKAQANWRLVELSTGCALSVAKCPVGLASDQAHVIERFTRPSKNYLIYQVTIDDPVVLTKPWKSAPRTWSLAQDPHDEWMEVFCTHNEEPDEIKKIDAAREKGK